MRLFVALGVPRSARARILASLDVDRLPRDGVTWTRPEGWHLTLAFIGEVASRSEPDVVDLVAAAVADLDGPAAIRLTTGRSIALGRVAIGLEVHDEPAGAVAALGARIQHRLMTEGLPVNERQVRPHVTLARVRAGASPGRVRDRLQVPEVSWHVDDVQVVESLLGEGPARYEVCSRVALASASG